MKKLLIAAATLLLSVTAFAGVKSVKINQHSQLIQRIHHGQVVDHAEVPNSAHEQVAANANGHINKIKHNALTKKRAYRNAKKHLRNKVRQHTTY